MDLVGNHYFSCLGLPCHAITLDVLHNGFWNMLDSYMNYSCSEVIKATTISLDADIYFWAGNRNISNTPIKDHLFADLLENAWAK